MTHRITITYGDGAVNEHPRGTICYIAPNNPEDDQVIPRTIKSSTWVR